MNFRNLILIVAVMLLLTHSDCKKCSDLTDPACGSSEYFPVQIGNEWTYSVGRDLEETVRIVGTKTIGASAYFVFENRFSLNENRDSSFIKVGVDGKIFRNVSGQDYLFLDFNRPINEWWDSYGGFKGMVQKRGVTIDTPAGTFKDCIQIFLDIPQVADDEQWFVFAPGVGSVAQPNAWFDIKLKSARVNGKSYP
jgi:hypothetical protein